MWEVRLKLPVELLDKLQLLSHRAENNSGTDVSVETVALMAIIRGLSAVEREVDHLNHPRKLRLVK